jgi:hypothetical protein
MPDVQLYNRETIQHLSWPETEDGDYARRYLLPMLLDGPQTYIRNVHRTEMLVAKVGETVLPLTVTDFHPENTFTCSPYSHYISYGGYEEVHRLNNPPVEGLIRFLLHPLAWVFRRTQFDRAVYVNNWLLSTNLYPVLAPEQIRALTEALPGWFPDRAIVFRSVDSFRNPVLYQALREQGAEMVLSRQVWYQDPPVSQFLKHYKEDVRITRRNGHVVSEVLTDEELPRALELYGQLYLEKYSHFNPQFTEAFLRLARDQRLLTLRLLRREGQINGVVGYFVRNGVMTPPFYGYDLALPQTDGLYRMLGILTLQEGLRQGLLVHASAGVGKFKKRRGGNSTIEYNAVFTGHLPAWRRFPWALVRGIANASIPVFRKYDL